MQPPPSGYEWICWEIGIFDRISEELIMMDSEVRHLRLPGETQTLCRIDVPEERGTVVYIDGDSFAPCDACLTAASATER